MKPRLETSGAFFVSIPGPLQRGIAHQKTGILLFELVPLPGRRALDLCCGRGGFNALHPYETPPYTLPKDGIAQALCFTNHLCLFIYLYLASDIIPPEGKWCRNYGLLFSYKF